MTTQYTSILKLALPVQGELSGTWGDVVNDNITSMVEEAVAGRAVINTWTTNSHVLTTADGTTSESRCAMLEFTDTGAALTGAATVVCPNASKLYVCKNDSGQQVTIQTAAGTGVAIPDGQTMFVFCDGTNVEQCETNFNSLSFNGYTLNFGGAVTTAGAFTTSGAYALTLTTTGATNVTLPTTGTLATLDGTETLTNKTLTAPTISSPTLTGSISATDLTISGNTTIGDASSDTLVVNSTITSNLIFTDDTYDIGAVGATRPRNLFLSGNATIGGTVTLSGGIDVTGALGVDGDFDVNTDKFTVASATGNTLVAGTLGVTGITTATGGLNVDTISEITASGGVTVDGVLLKDGGATLTSALAVSGNTTVTDGQITQQYSTFPSASGELLNQIRFRAENGFSAYQNSSLIQNISFSNWNSSREAGLRFKTLYNTTEVQSLDLLNTGALVSYRGAVFNEDGGDYDFRVESDNQSNMFFINAGTDQILINDAENKGTGPMVIRQDTNYQTTDMDNEPTLYLQNETNVDTYGGSVIVLEGNNSSGSSYRTAIRGGQAGLHLYGSANNVTAANHGELKISQSGTSSPGDVIINEGSSSDTDFRVESDNNANMLFVDASIDSVGIGTTPSAQLHVKNTSSCDVRVEGGSNSRAQIQYKNDAQQWNVGINGADNYVIYDNTNSFEAMTIGATTGRTVIFNENSVDLDFRVESDNNANMIFVDAGADHVNIGTATDYGSTLNVFTTGTDALEIVSDNGNANAGPYLDITRKSSSPADGDNTGAIRFLANSDAAETIVATVRTVFDDVSNASEDSSMYFTIRQAGAQPNVMDFSPSETVVNNESYNRDFRVESDGNSHAFFIDAQYSRIGINNSTPSWPFDALGNTAGQVGTFYDTGTNGGAMYNGAAVLSVSRRSNGSTSLNGEILRVGRDNSDSASYNVSESIFTVRSDSVVVNESQGDIDLRVESDNNTYALFFDAANNALNLNGTVTDSMLAINPTSTTNFGLTRTIRDRTTRIHTFGGSAGGATKTVTIEFGDFGLTGSLITVDISGHKYNNGGQYFYIRRVFAVMEESGNTRINSDQSSNLGFSLGNTTGAIGASTVSFPGGGDTRMTFTVNGEYDTKIWAKIEGVGSSSVKSVSVV